MSTVPRQEENGNSGKNGDNVISVCFMMIWTSGKLPLGCKKKAKNVLKKKPKLVFFE